MRASRFVTGWVLVVTMLVTNQVAAHVNQGAKQE
jgi:hypothetical protein